MYKLEDMRVVLFGGPYGRPRVRHHTTSESVALLWWSSHGWAMEELSLAGPLGTSTHGRKVSTVTFIIWPMHVVISVGRGLHPHCATSFGDIE